MTREFEVMKVMQVMNDREEASGMRRAACRYDGVSHLATAHSLQPTA
jgi:hypothetical protein